MKKILSLLMLLVAIVTGAKADVDLSQGASYDFTTITASAFANVGTNYWKADADTPTNYSNGSGFKPTSPSAFMLNATEEIAGFEGLQITTGSSSGRVKIYVNGNGLYFNSESAILTFPGLKKDQVITIGYANVSSDEAQFTVTNATAVQNTSTHVETLTVQANGDVTLTYKSKKFYIKTIEISSSGPSISASNVNISKEATNEGEIAFTVNNSVEGGVVTAAEKEEADWLTLGDVDNTNGKVPFTAEANTATSSRSAVVKLTYTYDTNKTATKEVTITQAPEVKGTEIIRLTLPGGKNTGDASGTIGGTYDGNTQSRNTSSGYGGCKLGSTGHYIGLTLATGNSFREGDIVEVKFVGEAPQTGDDSKVIFYDSKEQTNVIYNTETSPALGTYRYILPEGANGQTSLYLVRGTNKNSKFNPFIDYIAVYRPATVTLNSKGYATYSKATDFEFLGATAYKMALNENEKTITGTAVTGKIKAGEGILFKGEAGAKVSITNTTGAEALTGNNLKGTTTASGKATVPTYCYTLSGDTFKKFKGAAFNDNKAYLESENDLSGQSFEIIFDDQPTAISFVVEDDANVAAAPVKVIKNGQLFIGNYNVAGARIK